MPAPKFIDPVTHAYVHALAIPDPTGGDTTDAEARAAITAILAVLRSAGLITQT